jgi:hypothetical protein
MRDVIAEILTPKFWLLSVALTVVLSVAANLLTDALKVKLPVWRVRATARQNDPMGNIGPLWQWGVFFVTSLPALVYADFMFWVWAERAANQLFPAGGLLHFLFVGLGGLAAFIFLFFGSAFTFARVSFFVGLLFPYFVLAAVWALGGPLVGPGSR